MKKKLCAIIGTIILTGTLAGCADLDVVRKYAPGSLKAILEASPALVKSADKYFELTADGSTVLRVSGDFKASGQEDVLISTPLAPFLDAGLDPKKLGEGYAVQGDTLLLTADYGEGSGEKESMTDALFQAADFDRMSLTYHKALDHFGVGLPNGKIEWAKDYTNNDKDIVFVLLAEPLKGTGVDVEAIEGWSYMVMMGEDGTETEVLVRPHNL